MKKVAAIVLSICMVTVMVSGCELKNKRGKNRHGGKRQEEIVTETGTTEQAGGKPEENPAVDISTILVDDVMPEPAVHYTFDKDKVENYSVIVEDTAKSRNKACDVGMLEEKVARTLVDGDAALTYKKGAVGQALYLDGTFGLDLRIPPTNTDCYTISYWVKTEHMFDYSPTLQLGYNVGKPADKGNNVTWLNITQAPKGFGGLPNSVFPVVWSRNEASDASDGTDCWPWMYAFDQQVHGKGEWLMITLVCAGVRQKGVGGTTTVASQFYLNGALVYDSNENRNNETYFAYTWDASLAPDIMKPQGETFESYFGINYWDKIYKGYVDDLYVFNQALGPGNIARLYNLGR